MNDHLGWIQCTQCGWGCEVRRDEVEAGDYVDRQACDSCGIGPCRIDWTYPDGPGWVADGRATESTDARNGQEDL